MTRPAQTREDLVALGITTFVALVLAGSAAFAQVVVPVKVEHGLLQGPSRTDFVKTGDPNGAGVPKWPAFDGAAPWMVHVESGTTRPVPIVNESGLKVLDEYFAWRRSSAAPAPTPRR